MSASREHHPLSLDDGSVAWDLLADCLERFLAAWDQQPQPPEIADYLPDSSEALRHLALVELVKIDLEHRWQRAAPRCLEDYLAAFPELAANRGVPCDLIREEYDLRRRFGQHPDPREYFRRFPDRADELRRLLAIGQSQLAETTTLRRPPGPQVGDRLDDFELLAHLGQGAFANVYLARQTSMQRLVALKISLDRGSEPQTLAQLDHPGIVRVYDQRVLPDRPWRLLYMQYVPGGSLDEALEHLPRRAGPLKGQDFLAAVGRALQRRGESQRAEFPGREELAAAAWPEVVCWLGIQLAEALQYAHDRGVLHRDLKPANILLSAEGAPKLVDFNISFCAKLEGSAPAAYFGGSLAYMSPEQLEACNPRHTRQPDSLDARSDLYSLGIVLWETLTGTRPFDDGTLQPGWDTTLDAMTRLRQQGPDAKRLDEIPGGCPRALRQVLLKCLAPRPEDRFRSGAELAGQLRLCLKPRAYALLYPREGGWRSLAVRHPVLLAMTLVILPNLVGAAFNLAYNLDNIIRGKGEQAVRVFFLVQAVINQVAFPVGIGLGIWLLWPVGRALRQARQGIPPPEADWPWLRRRCLLFGNTMSLLALAEWLIAAPVYPTVLHLLQVDLSAADYLHFILSLALCGLIAVVYPFFGVTALAVRAWYPRLLQGRVLRPEDVPLLARLYQMTWGYLALGALLPMLGVAMLVVLRQAEARLALAVLSVGGVAGFLGVFVLARRIQRDLETLDDVVRPASGTPLYRRRLSEG